MQVLFNKRVESGENHNTDQLLKSPFLSSYEWIFTSKSGIMPYFPSCTHSFSHFLVLKLFLLHNYFYLNYYCFITINNWHPNGKMLFIKILFRYFFKFSDEYSYQFFHYVFLFLGYHFNFCAIQNPMPDIYWLYTERRNVLIKQCFNSIFFRFPNLKLLLAQMRN